MTEKPRIILASKSPRRTALLEQAGILHTVMVSNCKEDDPLPDEDPGDYAVRTATLKAEAVYASLSEKDSAVVLGADTVVALDGRIFGKPKDRDEAESFLTALSGKSHTVCTGVCIILDGTKKTLCERSRVFVNDITEDEIAEYITTGEPFDKAGAYGIQGIFARHIGRIEGNYDNIVGLPIAPVYQALKELSAL